MNRLRSLVYPRVRLPDNKSAALTEYVYVELRRSHVPWLLRMHLTHRRDFYAVTQQSDITAFSDCLLKQAWPLKIALDPNITNITICTWTFAQAAQQALVLHALSIYC